MTQKQELAKKRNWLKFRIKGLKIFPEKHIITEEESKHLSSINNEIQLFIEKFDDNSKKLGLNSTTEFEREEKRQKRYKTILRETL